MIGITGHMSGGKTYFAVETICKLFLQKHRVCSNIKLKCQGVTSYLDVPCVIWKRLYYYLNDDIFGYHVLPLSDYENYPTGSPRGSADYDKRMVYIFFDEISSVFDSLTHSSDANIQKVAVWARHTRKRGQEIYLIMQFASELHKRLRNHITEYVSCTNTSTLKIPFLGCGLPWFVQGWSVRVRYLQDGETMVGSASWVRITPSVYKCYDTAQIVYGSTATNEDDVLSADFSQRSINQVKRGVLCLGLFQLLLLMFALYFLFQPFQL